MIRSIAAVVVSVVITLGSTTGCAASAADPTSSRPSSIASSPAAFAGVWRSVTPTLEFLRLSVSSTSSEFGVMAARLTFSGVAWDGRGRISGDSLVIPMTAAGTDQATGTIIVRVGGGQALSVDVRPASASRTLVTFVRDN